jgi:O-antigen ligase
MTLQSILLGFVIATICGLLFHLIRGGAISRIGLYVVAAWIAFWAGQLLSMLTGWNWGRLGTLNLVPALAATFVGLFAASILIGSPGGWKRLLEPHDDPSSDDPNPRRSGPFT